MARDYQAVTEALKEATTLPLLVAPLFLNSTPELVLASVRKGSLARSPRWGSAPPPSSMDG